MVIIQISIIIFIVKYYTNDISLIFTLKENVELLTFMPGSELLPHIKEDVVEMIDYQSFFSTITFLKRIIQYISVDNLDFLI